MSTATTSPEPDAASGAPPPRRQSALRSALEYSVGSGLGLAASMLRVAMAARILTADERGLWLALQLAFNYGQNLHLGSAYGMFREVAMQRARGDFGAAEEAKRTTLTFVVLMGIVGWVGFAIFELAYRPTAAYRHASILVGILTFVTLMKTYYVSAFKAESRFRDLSISAAIGSLVSMVTLLLIWLAGLDGLVWGMIIQGVSELAWLVGRERRPSFGLDVPLLRGLLGVGSLTLATGLVFILLTTVDRSVMLSRLGTVATGYYYVGANIVALLPVVASLPASVLTPRFFEAYGTTGRGDSLVVFVERPVRAGSVLFAVCLGAGAIAIPTVVTFAWPDLTRGIDAARIAALGTFPLVVGGLVGNVFYAMNRQVLQLALSVVSAGVGFACASLAVTLHATIAAAAAGSAVGLFVFHLTGFLAAYQLMTGRWTDGAALFVRSLVPAGVAAAGVAVSERVGAAMPVSPLLRCVISELLFCACLGPWVFRQVASLRAPHR